MHLLLFFLVIVSCRPSVAVTSTKINYLPNGQVGGYELIISNTVQPRIHPHLPRDSVSKTVKHTSSFGSGAFTRVDERVLGENSYLKIHSILQQVKQQQKLQPQQKQQPQQQVRRKYPVKNVVMVPSIRYVNRASENVKLRFAQIGPYAALIVPVNESEFSSARSEFAVPPEFRDSVKAYIEVQAPQSQSQSLAQSSLKTKTYPYAPPSSHSPLTTPSMTLQQPGKTGSYIYPAATSPDTPPEIPAIPEIGNGNENGFVIRVVNPAKGDPNSQDAGNKYQEFFVPASSNQLEPDRDDKVIANPYRYSGSSGPSTSQFREVYSKRPSTGSDPSSEYRGRTNDVSLTDRLPESDADLTALAKATTDGKTGISNIGQNSESLRAETQVGQGQDSDDGHFQSGWSLVETQNLFGGPPPGQPEFSDVSPDSDLKKIQSQQYGLETNKNDQFPYPEDSSGSDSPRFSTAEHPYNSQTDVIPEVGQTSDATVRSSASVNPHLETFGLSTTQDAVETSTLNYGEPVSTQPLFDQDSAIRYPANSAQTLRTSSSNQRFQGPSAENEEQIPKKGSTFAGFGKFQQNDVALLPLNEKSVEAAVGSAQTADRFQGNNLGQMINHDSPSPDSGEPERFKGGSLGNLGPSSNEGAVTAGFEAHTGRFQGTVSSFEQLPNLEYGSAGQFQGTNFKSDVSSVQQFGEDLSTPAENNRYDATTEAISSADQLNRFLDTSASKMFSQSDGSAVDSNLRQDERFRGSAGQILGKSTNEGYTYGAPDSGQQFQLYQGTYAPKFGHISSDSSAGAAAFTAAQSNQLQDTTRKNLPQHTFHIPQVESASVALGSAQQQFQSQKGGQVLNAGHRNTAFTKMDGSGNLPFFDIKTFTQHPSLTTQLKFLSPNGQTAAVLTSTGDSAKVELPSEVPARGRYSNNIFIPKTVAPLPISGGGTSGEYKDRTILLDSVNNQLGTTFPSVRHRFNSFDSSRNVQSNMIGSSVNFGNQQQSNVFYSTPNDFNPVSNFEFDSAATAAAAAAAVAADNEHFNRFDTTEVNVPEVYGGSKQQEEIVTPKYQIPVESKAGIPIDLQAGSPANRLQSNRIDSTATAQFRPVVVFDPSGSAAAAEEEINQFESTTPLNREQLSPLDSVNLKYPPLETPANSAGESRPMLDDFSSAAEEAERAAAANAAAIGIQQILANTKNGGSYLAYENQAGNKNTLDELNKEIIARLTKKVPTFTHPQIPVDENKFKEGHLSSQFLRDETSSRNLNFRAQEPVGNSHINSALGPGIKPNGVLLSTPNGHVNVRIPEPTGESQQHGETSIPKYSSPGGSKARTAINRQPGDGSAMLHDRQYANAYSRYVTPTIRRYNEYGVRVVPSQRSPIVGPHTEKLLEVLNGLVSVPERQLPTPVPT